MTRLLALLGSGETTPTMVSTHQRVLDAVGLGVTGSARETVADAAVVLDTPYGFQENADELSARTVDYFARNVGREVTVRSLRDADALTPVALEDVIAAVRGARWVFAGPGSPSYVARQWRRTRLPEVLRDRLAGGSGTATVLASATAATAGAHVLPVYEIYKVGAEPHWQEGLDLLAPLGLDAVVVPHFDNAEGGTHDTRYCYLGERRLRMLEERLPDTTWVLGIDEHTAAVLDLDAGTVRVEGRGAVTVRMRDRSTVVPSGTTVAVEDLVAAATPRTGAVAPPAATATGVRTGAVAPAEGDPVRGAAERFDAALDDGRLLDAAEVTVTLEGTLDQELTSHDRAALRVELRRQVVALARVAQAGTHRHRDLVAPHVEVLLRLRDEARAARRFADADAIRDALVAAGVEVRDGADGSSWEYHDPVELARRG